MSKDEEIFEAAAFVNATPDIRFGMLFTQTRLHSGRINHIEDRFNDLEAQLKSTKVELSAQMAEGFKKQALLINPLWSEKELEDGIADRKSAMRRIWWGWIGATSAAILALATLTSGGVFIGGYLLKTLVHVPLPVVQVAPPQVLDQLHPLSPGNGP